MKSKMVVLGIILITFGVVAYVSLQIPTASQMSVSNESIRVMAGSNVPRIFHLPTYARVSGAANSVSGGNKDINFYVFDKGNYNRWMAGLTYSYYVYIYRATDGSSFIFQTDHGDDFYFVFDNPVGGWFGSDRFVDWSMSYEYKPYAPYGLPTLALLVAAGVLLIAWQQIGKLANWVMKLRICPNCNRKVPIGKPVCPHCGFDVEKSLRCKYCKTLYDRSLQKCPNCGAQNN